MPKPCTTRARITDSVLFDRPHHRDARVKIVRPIRYRFFGPYLSPRRPVTSSGTAKVSR